MALIVLFDKDNDCQRRMRKYERVLSGQQFQLFLIFTSMNQRVLESKEFDLLRNLYSDWDIAKMELDELSRAEQSNALTNILVGLLQPYNSKLPLLCVPTYAVHSLLYMGHPYSKLFLEI